MSLGEAYINIHANTDGFKRELEAQVGTAVAAVEEQQNAVTVSRKTRTVGNDPDVAAAKAAAQEIQRANLATTLMVENGYRDQQRAALAAAEVIKKANRDTALQIENDLQRQQAAVKAAAETEKAAAAARDAIRKKDIADNATAVRAHLDGVKEVQIAERAAYVEKGLRDRAAAAAQKAIDDNSNSFSKRLVGISSALSRIGFTGQTRLVTLGLTFGAPIAVLAAFTAAATAATVAVATFGIQSADAGRSATLQFKSLGLTMDQAKAQFKALQDLSDKGLQISNLDTDTSLLLQLGIKAQDTTKILSTLADVFAENGDVGAVLQKDIDDTTKKFATLVNTAKVTPRTFQAAVASLGIGVTAQAAFDQVRKNLGVTEKQLDSIIRKGGLSGAALASASLQVAAKGSAGGLANAVATSPTQATEALKSSAQSTLERAFEGSGTTIAGFINQVSVQLNGFLAEFGPRVIGTIQEVFPKIISSIKPFGDALIATMQIVGPAFKAIGPVVENLSRDVSSFFSQANTKGSDVSNALGGLKETFKAIGDAIKLAVDLSLPAIASLGPGLRIVGDVAKVIGNLAGGLDKITLPLVKLTAGSIHLGLTLIADALDKIASASDRISGAASAAEKAFAGFLSSVLDKTATVVEALSHVHIGPIDFTIPGADGVIDKLHQAADAIDALPSQKIINVDIVIATTGGIPSTFKLPDGSTVHDSEASRAAGAATGALTSTVASVSTVDHFTPDLSGGGGGGGGGNSAAKAKADAAKARAQAFADALKTIVQSIKDFKANVGTDTAKQINSTFESIEKSIAAAFKADKKKEPSALVKFLEDERKTLVADAKIREKLTKEIAAGDAAALAAIQNAQQFASLTSVATTVAEFGKAVLDLSRLHIVLPGDALTSGLTTQQKGVNSLQTALDKRLAVLKKFQKDIQTLIHDGLRADLVSDIISGGADANGALASGLAGASPGQIGLLNKTQQAITDVTSKLGKNAGDAAASAGQKAGQAVADGILQGLKDKNKDLIAAMKGLADALTNELKKTWKIKSPSQVARGLGAHYGTGLEHGLISTHGALARAAAGMAEAATPNMARAGIPLPRVGSDGYAQSVVHQTTHSKEINAPVTIHNYGPAEGVGDAVGRNIAKFLR